MTNTKQHLIPNTRHLIAVIGLGLAAAIAAAGCGSSSSKAATPLASATAAPAAPPAVASKPAPAKAIPVNYGAKYLSIIGPANAQIDKLAAWSKANPTATSIPANVIDPVTDAIQKADIALVRVTWPGQAGTDIRTLVSGDATLSSDLETQNWGVVTSDGNHLVIVANEIRADLGLPAS